MLLSRAALSHSLHLPGHPLSATTLKETKKKHLYFKSLNFIPTYSDSLSHLYEKLTAYQPQSLEPKVQ